MNRQKWIGIAVIILGIACGFIFHNHSVKPDNLIRLHVVANSNSPDDQALKYHVRDVIVSNMSDQLASANNVEEARRILRANLDGIKSLALRQVRAEGKNYPVNVSMGQYLFPDKTYQIRVGKKEKNLTLPAGQYEAVRVIIGQGAGENWWCVLFPPLCFVNQIGVTTEGEVKTNKNSEEDARGAVPAFKLNVPPAAMAYSGDNQTIVGDPEKIEFRFRVLDIFYSSRNWVDHMLGQKEYLGFK